MDELFRTVDSLSGATTSERVNPSDRSSKDKKKNGFSKALKEKMQEKLKEEDLLLLHDEEEAEEKNKQDDNQDAEQSENSETTRTESDESEDDTPTKHVDFKA